MTELTERRSEDRECAHEQYQGGPGEGGLLSKEEEKETLLLLGLQQQKVSSWQEGGLLSLFMGIGDQGAVWE